jgi:uncharacterized cupredoxin-like copper-binding protein
VQPGNKDAATFVIGRSGKYRMVCGVDDHEARGMVTTVTVS